MHSILTAVGGAGGGPNRDSRLGAFGLSFRAVEELFMLRTDGVTIDTAAGGGRESPSAALCFLTITDLAAVVRGRNRVSKIPGFVDRFFRVAVRILDVSESFTTLAGAPPRSHACCFWNFARSSCSGAGHGGASHCSSTSPCSSSSHCSSSSLLESEDVDSALVVLPSLP
jgi:hypothetical protein